MRRRRDGGRQDGESLLRIEAPLVVLLLALQLLFLRTSESMGNHDSNVVEASSVD